MRSHTRWMMIYVTPGPQGVYRLSVRHCITIVHLARARDFTLRLSKCFQFFVYVFLAFAVDTEFYIRC